ncbi:MAG TPA: hypothetical protein VIL48_07020 [Acidimicrobiales bacterium]
MFDLVIHDAYALSRWERARDDVEAACATAALVLTPVGYFMHADVLLALAAALIVPAWVPALMRYLRRRKAQRIGAAEAPLR